MTTPRSVATTTRLDQPPVSPCRPEANGPPAIPSLYAVACHYAAILDQEAAAAVRFEHHIPTLFPRSGAGKLHLRACAACGRPWQRSTIGACPGCPRLFFGPSPSSTAQAAPHKQHGSQTLSRFRTCSQRRLQTPDAGRAPAGRKRSTTPRMAPPVVQSADRGRNPRTKPGAKVAATS
jgi:hypothetical protein